VSSLGHTDSLAVNLEVQLIPSTYSVPMHGASVLEDWRGVDVGQIRAQLRLPVAGRVRVMVEASPPSYAAHRYPPVTSTSSHPGRRTTLIDWDAPCGGWEPRSVLMALPYLESLRDEINNI
jgi:hypothetical protein